MKNKTKLVLLAPVAYICSHFIMPAPSAHSQERTSRAQRVSSEEIQKRFGQDVPTMRRGQRQSERQIQPTAGRSTEETAQTIETAIPVSEPARTEETAENNTKSSETTETQISETAKKSFSELSLEEKKDRLLKNKVSLKVKNGDEVSNATVKLKKLDEASSISLDEGLSQNHEVTFSYELESDCGDCDFNGEVTAIIDLSDLEDIHAKISEAINKDSKEERERLLAKQAEEKKKENCELGTLEEKADCALEKVKAGDKSMLAKLDRFLSQLAYSNDEFERDRASSLAMELPSNALALASKVRLLSDSKKQIITYQDLLEQYSMHQGVNAQSNQQYQIRGALMGLRAQIEGINNQIARRMNPFFGRNPGQSELVSLGFDNDDYQMIYNDLNRLYTAAGTWIDMSNPLGGNSFSSTTLENKGLSRLANSQGANPSMITQNLSQNTRGVRNPQITSQLSSMDQYLMITGARNGMNGIGSNSSFNSRGQRNQQFGSRGSFAGSQFSGFNNRAAMFSGPQNFRGAPQQFGQQRFGQQPFNQSGPQLGGPSFGYRGGMTRGQRSFR